MNEVLYKKEVEEYGSLLRRDEVYICVKECINCAWKQPHRSNVVHIPVLYGIYIII